MSIKAIVLSHGGHNGANGTPTPPDTSATPMLGRWDSLSVIEDESLKSLGKAVQERARKSNGGSHLETLPILRETDCNGKRTDAERKTASARSIQAHLLLRTRPGTCQAVHERLSKLPESQAIYSVAGRYDIVATVGAESLSEFTTLLTERVGPMEGIDAVETAMFAI